MFKKCPTKTKMAIPATENNSDYRLVIFSSENTFPQIENCIIVDHLRSITFWMC